LLIDRQFFNLECLWRSAVNIVNVNCLLILGYASEYDLHFGICQLNAKKSKMTKLRPYENPCVEIVKMDTAAAFLYPSTVNYGDGDVTIIVGPPDDSGIYDPEADGLKKADDYSVGTQKSLWD